MLTWGRIHSAVLAIWVIAALLLAVDTALLGGEEAQLKRQRGADRKAQLELLHQRERLGAVVEHAASPALVEEAAERIGLDVRNPDTSGETEQSLALRE